MPQQTSIAYKQFPRVVWRGGEKKLWDPIHRRAHKNRPEERVRLRVIDYLIEGGWSKHRISAEEKIDSARTDKSRRTDLICYTQSFNPLLLVECKAENVKLSAKTALQIARYNRQVEAPFLLLTNGKSDYWYSTEGKNSLQPLAEIPKPLPNKTNTTTDRNYNYWKDRGFAGAGARPPLRSWIEISLNNLTQSNSSSVQHLSFKQQLSDLDLNHYYQTYKLENCRVAIGFVATEYGDSRLIAILNINGQNTAVMEINLDLLVDEREPNTSVYWSGGTQNMDVRSFIGGLLKKPFDGSETAQSISSTIIGNIL